MIPKSGVRFSEKIMPNTTNERQTGAGHSIIDRVLVAAS